MKKLTQAVKDKADKKWSFRAKDMEEVREWWEATGGNNCSFCSHFIVCEECPLDDEDDPRAENLGCCVEINEAWKAVRDENIKDFNAACEALQTRIHNLKVGE